MPGSTKENTFLENLQALFLEAGNGDHAQLDAQYNEIANGAPHIVLQIGEDPYFVRLSDGNYEVKTSDSDQAEWHSITEEDDNHFFNIFHDAEGNNRNLGSISITAAGSVSTSTPSAAGPARGSAAAPNQNNILKFLPTLLQTENGLKFIIDKTHETNKKAFFKFFENKDFLIGARKEAEGVYVFNIRGVDLDSDKVIGFDYQVDLNTKKRQVQVSNQEQDKNFCYNFKDKEFSTEDLNKIKQHIQETVKKYNLRLAANISAQGSAAASSAAGPARGSAAAAQPQAVPPRPTAADLAGLRGRRSTPVSTGISGGSVRHGSASGPAASAVSDTITRYSEKQLNQWLRASITDTHLSGQEVISISELLRLGANLEAKNAGGSTMLHIAASFGSTQVVRQLLNAGADPSSTDNQGKTPTVIAQERRKNEDKQAIIDVLQSAERARLDAAVINPSASGPAASAAPKSDKPDEGQNKIIDRFVTSLMSRDAKYEILKTTDFFFDFDKTIGLHTITDNEIRHFFLGPTVNTTYSSSDDSYDSDAATKYFEGNFLDNGYNGTLDDIKGAGLEKLKLPDDFDSLIAQDKTKFLLRALIPNLEHVKAIFQKIQDNQGKVHISSRNNVKFLYHILQRSDLLRYVDNIVGINGTMKPQESDTIVFELDNSHGKDTPIFELQTRAGHAILIDDSLNDFDDEHLGTEGGKIEFCHLGQDKSKDTVIGSRDFYTTIEEFARLRQQNIVKSNDPSLAAGQGASAGDGAAAAASGPSATPKENFVEQLQQSLKKFLQENQDRIDPKQNSKLDLITLPNNYEISLMIGTDNYLVVESKYDGEKGTNFIIKEDDIEYTGDPREYSQDFYSRFSQAEVAAGYCDKKFAKLSSKLSAPAPVTPTPDAGLGAVPRAASAGDGAAAAAASAPAAPHKPELTPKPQFITSDKFGFKGRTDAGSDTFVARSNELNPKRVDLTIVELTDKPANIRFSLELIDSIENQGQKILVAHYHGDGGKKQEVLDAEIEYITAVVKSYNAKADELGLEKANKYVIIGDFNQHAYEPERDANGDFKVKTDLLQSILQNGLEIEKFSTSQPVIKTRGDVEYDSANIFNNNQVKKDRIPDFSSTMWSVCGDINAVTYTAEQLQERARDLENQFPRFKKALNFQQDQSLGGSDHAPSTLDFEGIKFTTNGNMPTDGVKGFHKAQEIFKLDVSRDEKNTIKDVLDGENAATMKLFQLLARDRYEQIEGMEDGDEKNHHNEVLLKYYDHATGDLKEDQFKSKNGSAEHLQEFYGQLHFAITDNGKGGGDPKKKGNVIVALEKTLNEWTNSKEYKDVQQLLNDGRKLPTARDMIAAIQGSKYDPLQAISQSLECQLSAGYEPSVAGKYNTDNDGIADEHTKAMTEIYTSDANLAPFYCVHTESGVKSKDKKFYKQLGEKVNEMNLTPAQQRAAQDKIFHLASKKILDEYNSENGELTLGEAIQVGYAKYITDDKTKSLHAAYHFENLVFDIQFTGGLSITKKLREPIRVTRDGKNCTIELDKDPNTKINTGKLKISGDADLFNIKLSEGGAKAIIDAVSNELIKSLNDAIVKETEAAVQIQAVFRGSQARQGLKAAEATAKQTSPATTQTDETGKGPSKKTPAKTKAPKITENVQSNVDDIASIIFDAFTEFHENNIEKINNNSKDDKEYEDALEEFYYCIDDQFLESTDLGDGLSISKLTSSTSNQDGSQITHKIKFTHDGQGHAVSIVTDGNKPAQIIGAYKDYEGNIEFDDVTDGVVDALQNGLDALMKERQDAAVKIQAWQRMQTKGKMLPGLKLQAAKDKLLSPEPTPPLTPITQEELDKRGVELYSKAYALMTIDRINGVSSTSSTFRDYLMATLRVEGKLPPKGFRIKIDGSAEFDTTLIKQYADQLLQPNSEELKKYTIGKDGKNPILKTPSNTIIEESQDHFTMLGDVIHPKQLIGIYADGVVDGRKGNTNNYYLDFANFDFSNVSFDFDKDKMFYNDFRNCTFNNCEFIGEKEKYSSNFHNCKTVTALTEGYTTTADEKIEGDKLLKPLQIDSYTTKEFDSFSEKEDRGGIYEIAVARSMGSSTYRDKHMLTKKDTNFRDTEEYKLYEKWKPNLPDTTVRWTDPTTITTPSEFEVRLSTLDIQEELQALRDLRDRGDALREGSLGLRGQLNESSNQYTRVAGEAADLEAAKLRLQQSLLEEMKNRPTGIPSASPAPLRGRGVSSGTASFVSSLGK